MGIGIARLTSYRPCKSQEPNLMTREQREAWAKANPGEAALALDLFRRRVAPLLEEDLCCVREAVTDAAQRPYQSPTRKMYRDERRFQRELLDRPLNDKMIPMKTI